MRHLLQLLLQHFYSIRNRLPSSRQGKSSVNTVFCTPATSPEMWSCADVWPTLNAYSWQISGAEVWYERLQNQSLSPEMWEDAWKKKRCFFQRHLEKIRVATCPGPFIREVSKAAQANHCKEFFLKHWQDLRVQWDIAKWESSCETFQLWLDWRATPP